MKPVLRFLCPILMAGLLGAAVNQAAPAPAPRPQQPPPPVVSPEVAADHRVTFRLRDPNAKEVGLAIEGRAKPLPMQKDDQGVWSVTTEPLEPDFYGYSFVADGVGLLDPSNWRRKPNFLFFANEVYVPGPPSLPWEVDEGPHGVIHHHFYHSTIVGNDRDFFVYTPPGYDAQAKKPYPVLYLLHGYSDDASAWTAVGRANVILDNLIARGEAKPMLIVMPLGYGDMAMLAQGVSAFNWNDLRERNLKNFRDALLTEVMPQIAKLYRASADRQDIAIAGLSMGGSESLFTGLNNMDHFAWIGAFSTGGLSDNFDFEFKNLDTKANAQLHLLWVACGTDDHLIDANRKFRAWLTSKGVDHTDIETPGAHTWMVWRRNLANFAPLLFKEKK